MTWAHECRMRSSSSSWRGRRGIAFVLHKFKKFNRRWTRMNADFFRGGATAMVRLRIPMASPAFVTQTCLLYLRSSAVCSPAVEVLGCCWSSSGITFVRKVYARGEQESQPWLVRGRVLGGLFKMCNLQCAICNVQSGTPKESVSSRRLGFATAASGAVVFSGLPAVCLGSSCSSGVSWFN